MFSVITNESGRHGFGVVGPFPSRAAAEMWMAGANNGQPVEGFVKPLTSPADWRANDGRHDDAS